MGKMIIKYELSQEGQKQSLLTGGDGKKQQEIEVDQELMVKFLEIATIKDDGSAILDLSWNTPSINDLKIDYQWETVKFPGLNKTIKQYFVKDGMVAPKFDSLQSAEELIDWYKNNQYLYNRRKEELQTKVNQLNINFESELEQLKEESRIAFENFDRQQEENKKQQEIKLQQDKIEREKREQEKINWINQFGSDYLKNAIDLGYDCQRQYIIERVDKELSGFKIDFENYVRYKERSCPSSKSIDIVLQLKNDKIFPKVVWLTHDTHEENNNYYDDFEPCEAILIEGYLGKYDLIYIV